MIDSLDKPYPVDRGGQKMYGMPVYYEKEQKTQLYFALSKKVLEFKGPWGALVVFGDKDGANAATYPAGRHILRFDFPEKPQYENRGKPVTRKAFMDPLVEHVVKTGNKEQPQITVFLRPPPGMTDAKDAEGYWPCACWATAWKMCGANCKPWMPIRIRAAS